jgi:putative Holliday junction resolvase
MRVLAVDYGSKRTGLAVGDLEHDLPSALPTITSRPSVRADAEAIATLAKSHEVTAIAVGHPLLADGTEGPRARVCNLLASELAALGWQVSLVNERNTTGEARTAPGSKALDKDAAAAIEIWRRFREEHLAN